MALGAFVIGAIMAESRQLRTIERLIEPIRDMFSAIFFVAIGLLLDLRMLSNYAVPIAVISVAVVVGKVVTCGAGTFIAGHDGRTSLRVGMGLAQIGEFSFIIAALGLSLKVTSDFLYPIAVVVSAITTLLTPYLIKLADPMSARLAKAMPEGIARVFGTYTIWLQNLQPEGNRAYLSKLIRRSLLQVLINFALVAALFIAGTYFAEQIGARWLSSWTGNAYLHNTAIWCGTLILALPFLIAAYRKLKALSMLLAEVGVKPQLAGAYTESTRRIVAELIPIAAMLGILLMITALSASILPPLELLILVLVVGAGLTALLWRRFVRLHSQLQIALIETLAKPDDKH
jgi:CPA2 family monovalent cation:H+ antiporter-2